MTSRAALSAFGIGVFPATSLTFAAAQQARPAAFIARAAEALGGDARLRGIKTISMAGVEGAERCAAGACWETATMVKATGTRRPAMRLESSSVFLRTSASRRAAPASAGPPT